MLTIADKHSAFNLRVFSSVGRGETDNNSYIDLLMDYFLDRMSSQFSARLIVNLENLLGNKVALMTEVGLKDCIRELV